MRTHRTLIRSTGNAIVALLGEDGDIRAGGRGSSGSHSASPEPTGWRHGDGGWNGGRTDSQDGGRAGGQDGGGDH
jgi:hypothetical protein